MTNDKTQNIVTVARNQAGEPYALKINGGTTGAANRISDGDQAIVAINAVQDYFLGKYEFPEKGLHIRSGASNDEFSEKIGYVHASYAGNMVTPPSQGWRPISSMMGGYSLVPQHSAFNDQDHHDNAHIRHTVLYMMANGIGATIYLGNRTRNRWAKAVQVVTTGDEETRAIGIRSRIEGDRTWNKAKNIQTVATENLVCKGIKVDEIDLFTVSANALIGLQDNRGNTLKPRFWLPNSENVVKFFMAHAAKGGKVEVLD